MLWSDLPPPLSTDLASEPPLRRRERFLPRPLRSWPILRSRAQRATAFPSPQRPSRASPRTPCESHVHGSRLRLTRELATSPVLVLYSNISNMSCAVVFQTRYPKCWNIAPKLIRWHLCACACLLLRLTADGLKMHLPLGRCCADFLTAESAATYFAISSFAGQSSSSEADFQLVVRVATRFRRESFRASLASSPRAQIWRDLCTNRSNH